MSEQTPELSREELLRRYGKKPADEPSRPERRSPFKFLDSYDSGDADIFFGRDSEIEELLRHYHSYGQILIYGESGAGKSSLVQCGLRSRIPEADALFIPVRVHTPGLPALCREIADSASQQLSETVDIPPKSDLVATLRSLCHAASRPLVLFFDQFEELFIFHDAAARRRFADDLAAVMQARLNVKLIVGVRQDYLAHLTELEEIVEGLFENRFWLRRMSRENAAQAVVSACDTCGVTIQPEVVESVIQRLDPGSAGVELPYLQVVMDRLYRRAVEIDREQPTISGADVAELGDVADILGRFLVEEVERLPAPDTGRQILKAFITREGTRRTLDRETIATEAAAFGRAISPAALDAHLAQLASIRILREIADSGTFELRHDALAATVFGWVSEVEKELIEVRDNVLNRFKEYEARGCQRAALLDETFLDYLGVYRTRLNPLLDEAQRNYLELSKRQAARKQRFRRISIVGGTFVALLCVWLVAILLLWQQAMLAEERASAEKEKFDQARAAVEKFFITVSEDTLLNQPGMQGLRVELLDEARQFYEYFLSETEGDAQLDDATRRELARTHYFLGEIARVTEGERKALTSLEAARKMQLDLRSRQPGDKELLFDLGNTLNALGRAYDNLDQQPKALDAYEQALAVRRQLVEADQHNSEYQRKLASTMMNIALVKRAEGLDSSDVALCEAAQRQIIQAQQIRRQAVEQLQVNSRPTPRAEIESALFRLKRDLAIGSFNLATFEELMWEKRLKDEDEAFAAAASYYKEAILLLEQLSVSNDMEIIFLLAECHRKLGNAVDSLMEAEQHYQLARRRLEPLAYFNPNVIQYQTALARLHRNLGILYLDLAGEETSPDYQKYRSQARSAFRTAKELLEPWKDKQAGVRQDWEDIAEELDALNPR